MRKLVWFLAAWLGWKAYKKARLSYAETQPPPGADFDPAAGVPLPEG
jgi:hypothetical protein